MPTPRRTPTQQNHDGLVSLREYMEMRLAGMDEATRVAYASMERRLDGMNEFRQALRDQNTTFLTQGEHDIWKDKIDAEISDLRESRAELKGKASATQANIATLLAILGTVLSIIGLLKGFLQ